MKRGQVDLLFDFLIPVALFFSVIVRHARDIYVYTHMDIKI